MVLSRPKSEIKLIFWRLMILALGVSCVSYAEGPRTDRPPEYRVKAAFLYSFADFVEWPSECFPDSSSPIVIGILGKDPFGDNLEATVEGKIVRDRKLKIRRSEEIESLKQSHILFISSSEKQRIHSILAEIKGLPILTVGEEEKFAKEGVIFSFAMRDQKVHFIVNVEAAEKAELKISSRVLRLAEIVGDKHSNDQ